MRTARRVLAAGLLVAAAPAVACMTPWCTPPGAGPDARYIMRAWYAQNDLCRGGEGLVSRMACHDRTFSQALLEHMGWTGGDADWKRLPAKSAVRLPRKRTTTDRAR
jgi:hypothetical protein